MGVFEVLERSARGARGVLAATRGDSTALAVGRWRRSIGRALADMRCHRRSARTCARAACLDTQYLHIFIYPHVHIIPTGLAGGVGRRAARRRRCGGRACTGTARKGTRRVLKHEHSQMVLKNGTVLTGAQKQRRNSSGCLRQYFKDIDGHCMAVLKTTEYGLCCLMAVYMQYILGT